MKHYDMRRANRALEEKGIVNTLKHGEYCIVSCIDENGMPYGVPLSYLYSADIENANENVPGVRGALYFHTTSEGGRKIDAFLHDARACVTVVEDVKARFENDSFTTGYSSVIAAGRIRRISNPVIARKVLVDLCMKYLPDHKDGIGAAMQADFATTAVWALDIEEISGKHN